MSDVNVKIIITPPSKSSPGFARRLRKAASFQEKINGGQMSVTVVDEMIDFLADYCSAEGIEPGQLREALWDLSEDQFTELLSVVSGDGAQVPPVS